MKILIRKENSGTWNLVRSVEYGGETELQELLADSPSIIPVGDIQEQAAELVIAVREFGLPGSGNTDILAFSATGDIAIVECKLASNQEIKRKVIGQILEYGAYLWGMSYEEISQRVERRLGRPLAELVEEAFNEQDWDEEAFRTGVQTSLERGSFILIIAVDKVNDELSKTIRFLNGCGNPSFAFCVLEMERFESTGDEILVPHLHGQPSQNASPSGPRRTWNEQQFLEAVDNLNPVETSQVIKNLYVWGKATADRMTFGTGVTGTVSFHYVLNGRTVSVFTTYSNGTLVMNFGSLSSALGEDDALEFHKNLTSIPSFGSIPSDLGKWPSVKVADAFPAETDYVRRFKEIVEQLGKTVHLNT